MSFNQIKSISSIYTIQKINSSNYSTITLNQKTLSSGLIFSPYLPIDPELYNEILKKQQRELREKKLNQLNNFFYK